MFPYDSLCSSPGAFSYKVTPFSDTVQDISHQLVYKMEKAMASHSSTLAWKIPWTEEPGGLQSMASLRVRHD